MKYRLFALSLALGLLAGCATPYQPMSLLGGYQEVRLAPDIYRVAFFGNGYTNPQLSAEYALRRCAEVTQQSGYRYFGILEVRDLSVQRSWTTPASAYTRGNLSVNSFGNTAYGTYTGTTFVTPAQTVTYNFPRPVLTIKMVNKPIPGAVLLEPNSVLAVQLPGVPQSTSTPPSSSGYFTGPPLNLTPRLEARIISFVKDFVNNAAAGNDLRSFFGSNVLFNKRWMPQAEIVQITNQQRGMASRIFPQRSFNFLSGPRVSVSQEPGCADVSYTVLGVLRNSLTAIEVTNAVQLTIKVEGDRLSVVKFIPKVLNHEMVR
jgi:hypothetical protein